MPHIVSLSTLPPQLDSHQTRGGHHFKAGQVLAATKEDKKSLRVVLTIRLMAWVERQTCLSIPPSFLSIWAADFAAPSNFQLKESSLRSSMTAAIRSLRFSSSHVARLVTQTAEAAYLISCGTAVAKLSTMTPPTCAIAFSNSNFRSRP